MAKLFPVPTTGSGVKLLEEDEVLLLDTRSSRLITVINTGAGIVTVIRIDSLDYEPDSSGEGEDSDLGEVTVSASEIKSISVDWPFYAVISSGTTARVAIV